DLEAVRVGQRDVAHAPGLIGRTAVHASALRFDLLSEIVDALLGLAVDAEALALLPVAPLLPVVLTDHERHVASLERDAHDLAIGVLPGLLDGEAEDIPIPAEARVEVVHGEARRGRVQRQRAASRAGLPRGPLRPGGGLLRRAGRFRGPTCSHHLPPEREA